MKKPILGIASVALAFGVFAEIKVSDVKVFSGYPWKEVVIGYTITGTDANADAIRLTATDKSANKNYTASILTGAKWTEGRHVLRWNAASEGVKFSSANVEFVVSVVDSPGVQLWEDGPYWAECNVGATKPEEYGYYFLWGGTQAHGYSAANGWWVPGGPPFAFTRDYCPTYGKSTSTLQSEGYINSTGNLVAERDTATVHLGAPWRMPTSAEIDALVRNCTTAWTTSNGVYGRLVTGKGACALKSIFLPAAGHGYSTIRSRLGSEGCYWSSTPCSDDSDDAWHLDFDSGSFYRTQWDRYHGFSVRPLRSPVQ